TYVSLCKIPLKQKKLSTANRKEVISLLGSSKEREELLTRYEIYDVLEELLLEEKRFSDLFRLRYDLGNLDGALELVLRGGKAEPSVGSEEEVQRLVDYAVTGRIVDNTRRRKRVSDKILIDLKKLPTHGQQKRIREWSSAINCLKDEGPSSYLKFGQMDDLVMKLVISLLVLDPDSLRSISSFDVLFSATLQQAIAVVKDILIGEVEQVSRAILTVCGVWKTGNSHRPYVVQAWSPLSKVPPLTASDGIVSAAKAWVVLRFSKAIFALHDISKHLWRVESPLRCAQFLNGYCPRNQNCPWKHQYVTSELCSTTAKHLLSLNSIFCGLTTLYNRRVMDEDFQGSFLKMRRSWQEYLIRALTWVSAFEQDEATMNSLLVRIRYDEALSNVASGLEALLFFRLKREWTERNRYSSLVEQLQLATALGVEGRFFRAFSYITYSENQGRWIWEQLSLLKKLERDAIDMNAPAFHGNITNLRVMLNRMERDGFSASHSVTSTFEFLATYLTFRTCGNDFVIPRSWLDLHVPRLYEIVGSKQVPAIATIAHRSMYQGCFLALIQTFCDVLRWLDNTVLLNHKFQTGKSDYSMSLIQPRNAELLAVSLLNLKLSAIGNGALPGFQDSVDEVAQVLDSKSVRQGHLHHSGGAVSVCEQLARSYSKYQGKNPLIVVNRGPPSNLQNVNNIGRMSIAQVLALESRFRPAQLSSQKLPQPSLAPSEEFTTEDIEEIKKIQLWWRARQYLQQSLMKQVKDWQLSHFKTLMATCPTGILRSGLRYFYVSRGFEILSKLTKAKDCLASTHTSIMSACEVMTEASAYEGLDRALTKTIDIERSLDFIAGAVSDSDLQNIIKDREFSKIRLRFDEVDLVIKKAHQGFEEIEVVLKEAYKSAALS
ncbi:MAG: hypothetical protein L6R42_005670, partial [Xanthoria sp. 1 TBL-2021]